MKNYIQAGSTAKIVASATVEAGDFVSQGSMFGIAQNSAAADDEVVIVTDGVYELPVTAAADVSAGDEIFTADGETLTTDPDGATRVGIAWSDATAAEGVATVNVKINA